MGKTFNTGRLGNGLFVDANGNVGVASQTPRSSSSLKVIESTNYVIEDNGDFGFKSNAYYNGTNNIYINSAAATRLYAGNGAFEFFTAPIGTAAGTVTFTSRFYISNTGNVGIGTTNVSDEGNLFLGAKSTLEGGQLVLQKGTSQTLAAHIDNYSDRFRIMKGTDTGSTAELMCVNLSSGNVGIGIVPQWNLSTFKALEIGNTGLIYAGSGQSAFVNNGYYDGVWRYKTNDYATLYSTDSGSHVWHTAPSGTNGNQLSWIERMRLNSNGLKFQNGSSYLNYYEEGTWTPILSGSNGGDYTAAGGNSGKYTRIGNVVTITCTLVWSGGGSYSGNLCVRGIPFTNGGNRCHGTMGAIAGGISLSSGYTYWSFLIDPGYSFVYIIQNSSSYYSHGASVSTSGTIYAMTLTYLI